MTARAKAKTPLLLEPRLRVSNGDEIALGPGKAELLDWVRKTGSITEAARKMGMSYMRAWTLIRTMNGAFKQPLVIATHGGNKRGGASLTPTGIQALELYQTMNLKCQQALKADWKKFQGLLRAP